METQIEKPIPPAPHECCGGGSCCPCVWDRYFEALRQWQQQQGSSSEEISVAANKPGDDEVVYR